MCVGVKAPDRSNIRLSCFGLSPRVVDLLVVIVQRVVHSHSFDTVCPAFASVFLDSLVGEACITTVTFTRKVSLIYGRIVSWAATLSFLFLFTPRQPHRSASVLPLLRGHVPARPSCRAQPRALPPVALEPDHCYAWLLAPLQVLPAAVACPSSWFRPAASHGTPFAIPSRPLIPHVHSRKPENPSPAPEDFLLS